MHACLALFVAFLLSAPPAFAHGGGHGEGQTGTPIPQSFVGVVAALRAEHAVATTALRAGNLDRVGRSAQALWDLADIAPIRAVALPLDDRKKVAAAARDLQQETNTFFAKAVAGETDLSQAALDDINADIDTLEEISEGGDVAADAAEESCGNGCGGGGAGALVLAALVGRTRRRHSHATVG
jgi:hypothetical protein